MGTAQTAPAQAMKQIKTRVKSVLDLDSKETTSVVKVGQFIPVENMKEFTERLNNDSEAILRVVNEGLEEYAKSQLESDLTVPYMTFDDEGEPTVSASEKNLLIFGTEDKEKQFGASVLNIAKSMFGYPNLERGANSKLSADEVKANQKLKAAAKASAIEMLLSNPAAVEALKRA